MGLPGLHGRPAKPAAPFEDVRFGRPYFLSLASWRTVARASASILALVVVDLVGLVLGLYAALGLRAYVFDPQPILWGLIWDQERAGSRS